MNKADAYSTRPEVFDAIRTRGADKAVLHYAADQGEAIVGPTAFLADGRTLYTTHRDPFAEDPRPSDEEGMLLWALAQPALTEIAGFPGDCDANGTLEWRSDPGVVELTGEKTVAVTYSFSEEV